jgi:hypothetical protein
MRIFIGLVEVADRNAPLKRGFEEWAGVGRRSIRIE